MSLVDAALIGEIVVGLGPDVLSHSRSPTVYGFGSCMYEMLKPATTIQTLGTDFICYFILLLIVLTRGTVRSNTRGYFECFVRLYVTRCGGLRTRHVNSSRRLNPRMLSASRMKIPDWDVRSFTSSFASATGHCWHLSPDTVRGIIKEA